MEQSGRKPRQLCANCAAPGSGSTTCDRLLTVATSCDHLCMVRRGSTVRVRQRALKKRRIRGFSSYGRLAAVLASVGAYPIESRQTPHATSPLPCLSDHPPPVLVHRASSGGATFHRHRYSALPGFESEAHRAGSSRPLCQREALGSPDGIAETRRSLEPTDHLYYATARSVGQRLKLATSSRRLLTPSFSKIDFK
jgi:hypothetical protein